jgi:hypothetical protein
MTGTLPASSRGFTFSWRRAFVVVVGNQNVARIDVRAFQSPGCEGCGYDTAGKHFAEGGDEVVGARSDFADG